MLSGESVDRPKVGLDRLHGSDWAQFKDEIGSHATRHPCCTLAWALLLPVLLPGGSQWALSYSP